MQLLKITGGKHTWPNWNTTSSGTCKDFFADVELWRFFLKHPLGCKTTAATEPKAAPEITIWPNPTSDFLNVTFSENQKTSSFDALIVADFYGKVLRRKQLTTAEVSQPVSLDLNGIPAGGYFLIAETEGQNRLFRRFVVLR